MGQVGLDEHTLHWKKPSGWLGPGSVVVSGVTCSGGLVQAVFPWAQYWGQFSFINDLKSYKEQLIQGLYSLE